MQRALSNQTGSSSFKLLKEVQAQGGVMRTVVAMKSTVMKISVHNRQQVCAKLQCPPAGTRGEGEARAAAKLGWEGLRGEKPGVGQA